MNGRGRHEHPATRWWSITGDPGVDQMIWLILTFGLVVIVALVVLVFGWPGEVIGLMVCLPSCVRPTTAQCHCGACHETFGGAGGFDRHRSGGECLSPEAIGLVRDDRGVWRRLVERVHPRAATPEHPRVMHGQSAAMDNRPAGKLPSAAKSPGQSLINSASGDEAVTVVDG